MTDQLGQALDAALFQMSGTTLTVTPTLATQIASPSSPVVLRVTQAVNQVDISNNQITVVWDAANIIIECTISRFDVPTLPVTTQYVINSGPLVINVAPAFAQYPPCNYAVTEHFTWETDPYGALYTGSDYTLTINDSDLFHAKTYKFKLINSIAW